MELMVNERFRRIAPPLSENELRLLKEDILANGCRDPLVVWNGVIVDGHHRYSICKENGIPFQVMEMSFSSEDEALIWIARNQLGRRNLNAFQRCELVLPLEQALAAEAERRRRAGISLYRQTGETGTAGKKTRDILAEMAGVSYGLLRQVKAILEAADDETKDMVRSGELKIHTAYKRLTHKPPKAARDKSESAADVLRELLRKVTYGEADPQTVIMDLTRALEMMEG